MTRRRSNATPLRPRAARPASRKSWTRRDATSAMLVRTLTAAVAAAVFVVAPGCSSPPRPGPLPAPPPAAPPSAPNAHDLPGHRDNATYANYRFRDGEVLAQLRIHYTVLGQPHRNAQGSVDRMRSCCCTGPMPVARIF